MDGALFDPLGGVDDCLAGRGPVHRRCRPAHRRGSAARLSVLPLLGEPRAGESSMLTGLAAVSAQRPERSMSFRPSASAARCGACSICRRSRHDCGDGRARGSSTSDGAARPAARPMSGTRTSRMSTGASRCADLVRSVRAGLKERWRLSNDDIATAERMLAAARLLIEFQINEAAYRYPAALADAVDVAAALAGWTEAGKSAVRAAARGDRRSESSRSAATTSSHADWRRGRASAPNSSGSSGSGSPRIRARASEQLLRRAQAASV